MENKPTTITFKKSGSKGRPLTVILPDPTLKKEEVRELIRLQRKFKKLVIDIEGITPPSIHDIYKDVRNNCNGDSPWIDHITETNRTRFIELYRRYIFPLAELVRVDDVWLVELKPKP